MRKLVLVVLALAAITVGVLYVGFSGGGAQPTATIRALDVYNLDKCGQHKWIRVTDARAVGTILSQRAAAAKQAGHSGIQWIGGVVTLDPAEPGGWKFDPATVIVAGNVAEGMRSTICTINENPGKYVGGIWYVQQGFSQYREQ